MPAEPGKRTHLQRVPPHDLGLEAAILGHALLTPDSLPAITTRPSRAFYAPGHQTIHHAIVELHQAAAPVDPLTVSLHLRNQGALDGVTAITDLGRGQAYLIALTGKSAYKTQLPGYLKLLDDFHRRRDVLALTAEIVDATYAGHDPSGLLAQLHDASIPAGTATSWTPVNLAATLAGDGATATPAVLARADGPCALYTGMIHAFNAEPEAGKSWLALHACRQVIDDDGHVLYIDFEAGPVDVTERLLAIGLPPSVILERFHYIRPDDPLDQNARLEITAALEAWPIRLAIIDGVAEALALNGWDENKAGDVTTFYNRLPRHIARTGPAVVLIDHVVKDKEGQGRYARGSTAKLGGVDGATYKLEPITPFARAMPGDPPKTGRARILVTKDRHGHVRGAAAGGRTWATLTLTSKNTGAVHVTLTPPETDSDGFRPTILMERISIELEKATEPMSGRAIEGLVHGKATAKRQALEQLVREGHVTRADGPKRSVLYTSTTPFRQEPETTESDEQDHGDDF